VGTDDDTLSNALGAALEPQLGTLRIEGLARLTGGASRETWSFDAVTADGTTHELVLRRDPPSRPAAPGAMGLEARAVRASAAEGVVVPEILLDTDGAELWGSAGMVMHRIPGETLARRILRDDRFAAARARLAAQCGQQLAALHRVDPDAVGGLDEPDPVDLLRRIIDDFGEPVPTFELALRWLDANRPAATGRTLVHGDFRLGNLMIDEDGLRAVLDWELVHTGDPVEDLGWLCVRAWRFGAAPPVGGFGTREELLAAYHDAGGAAVPLEVLRWWEVCNTLRWGAICLTQTSVHLRGDLRSVELAAIGRRVCETEWDLLLLIDPERAEAARAAAEDGNGAAGSAPDGAGLHGRPTSAELVEAVQELLTEQVMAATTGALAFQARVAANVLAIVGRELQAGQAPLVRRAAQLERLGVGSEADLAAAIRAGRLPTDDPDLRAVLAEGVVARVQVANPRYLGPAT
jgi:aminoglycoside phosphotransferase (APT) family kinase protein